MQRDHWEVKVRASELMAKLQSTWSSLTCQIVDHTTLRYWIGVTASTLSYSSGFYLVWFKEAIGCLFSVHKDHLNFFDTFDSDSIFFSAIDFWLKISCLPWLVASETQLRSQAIRLLINRWDSVCAESPTFVHRDNGNTAVKAATIEVANLVTAE